MEIPTDFKTAISKVFYDKTVTIYSSENVVDDEGWSRDGVLTVVDTFLGNARYDRLAEFQESYGIREDISVIITCSIGTEVSVGDTIAVSNKTYRIIQLIPFDSHKLIIGQKWSSKSSISPSV